MTHQQAIIASIVSNLAALVFLFISWKRKNIARVLFSLLFIWASWANWTTATYNPSDYLEYSKYAIEPYVWLIDNIFSKHIQGYVYAISACQLLIGLGFLGRGILVKLSCTGGIIFLMAIAPLGLGSAFPFSITASIALYLLYRHSFKKDIFMNKWWV